MIKNIFICCVLLLNMQLSYAQIGIGTKNPDGSSILDVSSTNKGFLFPRMTTLQRDSIVTPANGLTIYNLDEDCLQINTGTTSSPDWACVGKSTTVSVFNNCYENGFEGTYAYGAALTGVNKFSVTISNQSFNSISIGFNTGDLVISGVNGLSVSSVSPASTTIISGGSQIVEYTLTGTPGNVGTLTGVWTKLGLNCTKAIDVIYGDATFTLPQTVIVLSMYDGTPLVDIQGIVDNSTNQLTIDIPYTNGIGSYIAYNGIYTPNNAGTAEGGDANSFRLTYPGGTFSNSGSITATIEVDGDGSFNVKKNLFNIQEIIASLDFQINSNSKGYVNLEVASAISDRNFADANHKFIYLPVPTADGNIWLNHNLGANYSNMNHAHFNPTQQAMAYNDLNAYGSLFQWGRYSDGHELITYSTSSSGTPAVTNTSPSHSTTTTPNNTTFYIGDDSPVTQNFNWLDLGASPNATEDGLWQGESGPNNPCPQGYRIPTTAELDALFSAEGITNSPTAASSSLGFTVAGYRMFSIGTIDIAGVNGYYWSSSIGGPYAQIRHILNNSINPGNINRAYGMSVRCLKD